MREAAVELDGALADESFVDRVESGVGGDFGEVHSVGHDEGADAFAVERLDGDGVIGDGLVEGIGPNGDFAVVVGRAERRVAHVVDEVCVVDPDDDEGVAGINGSDERVDVVGEVLTVMSEVRPVVGGLVGEALPLSQDFNPYATVAEALTVVTSVGVVGGGGSTVTKNIKGAEGGPCLIDAENGEQTKTNCEPMQIFHIASLPSARSK